MVKAKVCWSTDGVVGVELIGNRTVIVASHALTNTWQHTIGILKKWTIAKLHTFNKNI